jgi:hypothetical protein
MDLIAEQLRENAQAIAPRRQGRRVGRNVAQRLGETATEERAA